MTYMLEILSDSVLKDRFRSVISQDGDEANGYEELLQKAENDIRQHIRVKGIVHKDTKLILD
jgi:hypothetical protein